MMHLNSQINKLINQYMLSEALEWKQIGQLFEGFKNTNIIIVTFYNFIKALTNSTNMSIIWAECCSLV